MVRHLLRRVMLTLALMSVAAAAPALAQSPSDNAYVLGPGDEIEVTIFGPTDETVKTRVKEDGSIVVPHLGTLSAQGRTARSLGEFVAGKLEAGGYYVRPVVKVDVLQFVSNTVTVQGNVAAPGLIPIDRAMTVGMTVARAGGARSDGADFAYLTRKGTSSPIAVAFSDVSRPGEAGNMPVGPGDIVVIPPAPMVYVYGMVSAPGSFPMRQGMTVRQAIARAGGPTLAGSAKSVVIYRGGKRVKKVDLESPVQAEDTLRVPEKLF